MEVLYKDQQVIVCVKPVGILSQADGQKDMVYLLRNQFGGEIYAIHRLDRNVGGVMVYARTQKAAAALSEQIRQGTFVKRYLAAVQGIPEPKEGKMRDLLFRDSRKNKSFVVDRPRKGTKEALLDYRTIGEGKGHCGGYSVVEVRLHTGRTHQIRVQFASRRMPLLGDGKYGSRDKGCDIALWSHRITFTHPTEGKTMEFAARPDGKAYPWNVLLAAGDPSSMSADDE